MVSSCIKCCLLLHSVHALNRKGANGGKVASSLENLEVFMIQHHVAQMEKNAGIIKEIQTVDKRPNIVWIMADDLHYEAGMMTMMPNMVRLQKQSLEFKNHVSQSPLCGPSRASLLVGRYPHNSGYKTNHYPTDEFTKAQDESVGKWLTTSGYYTAFLGKYPNEVACQWGKDVPTGWRHFGGFSNVWNQFTNEWTGGPYSYYNASQWDLRFDETGLVLEEEDDPSKYIKIREGMHQADYLATQTIDEAKKAIAINQPFFIFTNPTMVHSGSCDGPPPYQMPADTGNEKGIVISPCVKRDRPINFLTNHFGSWTLHAPTANYNMVATGQNSPGTRKITSDEEIQMDYGRRNRTGSALDLDDMIGTIMDGLEQLRVLHKTYLIFTSDNGFHIGSHQLFYGKETPYEHDVRVPMFIRTPLGQPGVRVLPTTHVDITRTIVDLTSSQGKVTPSLDSLDGQSFVDALSGAEDPFFSWRRFSYSEMFEARGNTWQNIRYVGDNGNLEWSLNFWCSGKAEVYNMTDDQEQMLNILDPSASKEQNDLGNSILQHWMPVIVQLGSCTGAKCSSAHAKGNVNEAEYESLLQCEEEREHWMINEINKMCPGSPGFFA